MGEAAEYYTDNYLSDNEEIEQEDNMETRLEKAINEEAANISLVYGIRDTVAKIILMKGITIYQDSRLLTLNEK